MDHYLNVGDVKSFIVFLHLSGLALGIGGSWILDLFVIKHIHHRNITEDRFYLISFISKLVNAGLIVLWFSGLSFLAYYFLFTPENLLNEKIWGKLVIVTVLTVNGYFVHTALLPRIKSCIGSTIIAVLPQRDIHLMASIGTISFFSWLFPIVLGVSKSLNFTTTIVDITSFYLVVIMLALALVNFVLLPVSEHLAHDR